MIQSVHPRAFLGREPGLSDLAGGWEEDPLGRSYQELQEDQGEIIDPNEPHKKGQERPTCHGHEKALSRTVTIDQRAQKYVGDPITDQEYSQ